MSLYHPPRNNNPIPNNPFHSPEVPATFDRLFGARVANEQLDPNPSDIPSGGGGWVRPTDWLPLPSISPTEEKFAGLFAVYDAPENFIALYFEGDYVVEWGDGSVEQVDGGTVAEHSFQWANVPPSTLTSNGHKQVVVTVTPQQGENLTLMDLSVRHQNTPTGDTYSTTPWLDIKVSMPQAEAGESLIFTSEYSGGVTYSMLADLKELNVVEAGSATDIFSSYAPLPSIRKLTLNSQYVTGLGRLYLYRTLQEAYLNTPSLDTVPFGNGSWPFGQVCLSLKKVIIGDLLTATDIDDFFSGLPSLVEVQVGNMPLVERANDAFSYCQNLTKVVLGETPSLVMATDMFWRCASLIEAPLFDTSGLEEFSGVFTYCDSLERIPQYDLSNVGVMYETFYECYSLKYIPPLNLSSLETAEYPFYYCSSLVTFPDISLSGSTTNVAYFFDRCSSLQTSGLSGVSSDIRYVGCQLGRDAIVQIFNNLEEAEATIYIEGNYGTADLTAEDIAIAEDKGWTVIY